MSSTTFLQFKRQFGKPKTKEIPENSLRRGSFDMVDPERDRQLFQHFMFKQYQMEKCKLKFIERWLNDSILQEHTEELYKVEKCSSVKSNKL